MTFEEYLTKRRVNVAAFAAAEPQRFAEWQDWFGQMHPESFYMLVKMVLNDVRRNYWLAEVPKPVVAAEASENTVAAPARPAGRRAAITRPAAPTSETEKAFTVEPQVAASETKPTEATSGTSEEPPVVKPGRPVFKPRGVVKKPAVSEEMNPEIPETGKAADAKPAEEARPANENTNEASEKPARPRAVIKRPAALAKPTDVTEKTPGESEGKPAADASGTPGNSPEKVVSENLTETPKPARPRPVFKRPSPAPSTENSETGHEKTLGETPEKPESISATETPIENPVALPGQEGASEAKAVSEEIHDNPEAARAAEEVAAEAGHVPKPPRPRPVFKRPVSAANPADNAVPEPEKTLPEKAEKPEAATTEVQPVKAVESPSETVGDSVEKVEEPAPKPPRPRPIFKRPAKPESDNENPQ